MLINFMEFLVNVAIGMLITFTIMSICVFVYGHRVVNDIPHRGKRSDNNSDDLLDL